MSILFYGQSNEGQEWARCVGSVSYGIKPFGIVMRINVLRCRGAVGGNQSVDILDSSKSHGYNIEIVQCRGLDLSYLWTDLKENMTVLQTKLQFQNSQS